MPEQQENVKIENIIVLPRTKSFCEYTINNSESHAKHYEDMYRFLLPFLPNDYYPQIRELLFAFRPFVIIIKDPPEVIELISTAKDDIKKVLIKEDQKKQMKEKQNEGKGSLEDQLYGFAKNYQQKSSLYNFPKDWKNNLFGFNKKF